MRPDFALLPVLFLALQAELPAAELSLKAPLDYQVVQRVSPGKGLLHIVGELSEEVATADSTIETRILDGKQETPWVRAGGSVVGRRLTATVESFTGGWWRLEVRVALGGKVIASGSVAHVAVGEVFVVAGQSTPANHGDQDQPPQSGRVSTFDGTNWRTAERPNPVVDGGGSILFLADAVVAKENVPVGIVACGVATKGIREWLPNGAAYDAFVAKMKLLGPQGFRAVLWQQEESETVEKDPAHPLPDGSYRESLEELIGESRSAIGWDAPWFVAQGSDPLPGGDGGAGASLWKDSIALKGGLREQGAGWAAKVLPWLDQQWTAPRSANGGTEWSMYAPLPGSHSLGWVSANVQSKDTKSWNGVLDEAKWGTPAPDQVVGRNWDWKISDAQWAEVVKQKGEGKSEEVKFDLWLPDAVSVVKGIVVMSGHGSGESLFRRPDLRTLAAELHLGLFKFTGNPMQRGFWPRSLLFDRLKTFGLESGHPELEHAPLFLYGHSNGTGFSAVFPAYVPERVWGWVSMRPGITFQVYQPGAAQVPGLVIFGEDDPFLSRPSKEENLAVVPALRKNHDAVWNFAVEPKTGHGPGEKTWPLVFSFLRHTFAARVPEDADPRQGPVKLHALAPDSGHLGQNWDPAKGGYQTLPVAPFASFTGDKASASWLLNPAYAADWQGFQRDGAVNHSK